MTHWAPITRFNEEVLCIASLNLPEEEFRRFSRAKGYTAIEIRTALACLPSKRTQSSGNSRLEPKTDDVMHRLASLERSATVAKSVRATLSIRWLRLTLRQTLATHTKKLNEHEKRICGIDSEIETMKTDISTLKVLCLFTGS